MIAHVSYLHCISNKKYILHVLTNAHMSLNIPESIPFQKYICKKKMMLQLLFPSPIWHIFEIIYKESGTKIENRGLSLNFGE